jgi:hypothetical protein
MSRFMAKLFGSRRQAHSPRVHRARNKQTRPKLEELETRLVPIVSAFGTAYAVAPGEVYNGIQLDGVVEINNGCTGSLLGSGRHILTAAHCVDSTPDTDGDGYVEPGDGVVNPGTYNVRFDLPGVSPIPLSVPASSVVRGMGMPVTATMQPSCVFPISPP